MYSGFYSFNTDPFAINPGDDYIFESFGWGLARTKIYDALVNNGGAWVIAGPSGIGKTTFCRRIWNDLSLTHKCIFIRNTFIDSPNLMQNINKFMGVSSVAGGVEKQLNLLENHLQNCAKKGEKSILILDEAQNVDAELLESLLRISFQGSKFSFYIILSGRKNLYTKFASGEETFLPEMKIDLGSFTEEEVAQYIKFCLRQAGNTKVVFNETAIKEVYHLTGGVPFMVSSTCREALELSARIKSFSVSQVAVTDAARKVQQNLLPEAVAPYKTHFVYLGLISLLFFSVLVAFMQIGITPIKVKKEHLKEIAEKPDIVSMMIVKKQNEEVKNTKKKPAKPDFASLNKKQFLASKKLYAALELLVSWKQPGKFLDEMWLLYQKDKDIDFEKLAVSCGFDVVSFFADVNFLKQVKMPMVLEFMNNGDLDYVVLQKVVAEGVYVKTFDDREVLYEFSELKKVWLGHALVFVKFFPFSGENIFLGSKTDQEEIKYIQQFLADINLLYPDAKPGIYDTLTKKAVIVFQKQNGFVGDGVLTKSQQLLMYMQSCKKIPLIKNEIIKIEE